MADTNSDAAPAPARKKSRKKLILFSAVGLLFAGGAGAGGFYASGMLGGSHAEASEKPAKVATLYLPIDATFTANVKDSDSVMQTTIGVSTAQGQGVLDAIKTHDLPIRSAVLLALSDADGDALLGNAGKNQLRRQLKVAINDVLKAKGEGVIDDVYFTTFIIS